MTEDYNWKADKNIFTYINIINAYLLCFKYEWMRSKEILF